MFNRTRNLYKKILQGNKPSEVDIDRMIEMGRALESLKKHNGWAYVEDFIKRQRVGTHQYMEKEVGVIRIFSLPWLFSTFLKYLGMLFENRAYTKINNYMEVSIQNGRKQAARRARASEVTNDKE